MEFFWEPDEDDGSGDPDLELVDEQLLSTAQAAGQRLCSADAWWVVTHEVVVVRSSPSLKGKPESLVHRGKLVYVRSMESAWLQVDLRKQPPHRVDARKVAFLNRGPEFMWMMWDGKEKDLGMLLRPVAHLVALSKYRSSGNTLPRDAITWTIDEVNMFLGTSGFVKPGRQTALMRDSRRLVRSVRGGVLGLEYRVDSSGKQGGIFAGTDVPSHTCVEVCPLLEVNKALHRESPVLQRITVKMQGKGNRYGILLGYGKLYSSSPCPNLNWSYHIDDQVVLWTREEVYLGTELTVDLSAPPTPFEECNPMPTTWQPPPENTGKLAEAGYIIHAKSVVHGWGVFVTKDVPAGQLLEVAPALIMDQAGADAMHNYRWGLKEGDDPNYYIPLGYGCLYNHSEDAPVARGCLDVKRSVLEFYSTAEISKGQEVFVTYGDKYFDEDFAGHRKSELLQIEAINTNGDTDLHKLIELQRALIHCFSSEEFTRRMKIFNRERAARSLGLKLPNQSQVHNHVSVVVDVQLPILERYGYSRNREGALKMQDDVWKTYSSSNADENPEAAKNNKLLGQLLNHGREPAAQLRETMELQLRLLGNEAWMEDVLTIEVPRRAPCSLVYYLLRERFFPDQSDLKLVRRCDASWQWQVLKEMEAIPVDCKIYIAGVGDTAPNVKARSSDKSSPEALIEQRLDDWEAISKWVDSLRFSPTEGLEMLLSFWSYSKFDMEMSSFKIHGTWDAFKGNEMSWTGSSYVYVASLGEQGWESFQIVLNDDWSNTLYPNVKDAGPTVKHTLCGPDGNGHGFNWTLGGRQDQSGKPGHKYKIELRLNKYRGLDAVIWSNLGQDAKQDLEQLERTTKFATAERAKKRESEEKKMERDSEFLNQEFLQRRYNFKAITGGVASLYRIEVDAAAEEADVPAGAMTTGVTAKPQEKSAAGAEVTKKDSKDGDGERRSSVDSDEFDLMQALGLAQSR